jgi:hypothetical protein
MIHYRKHKAGGKKENSHVDNAAVTRTGQTDPDRFVPSAVNMPGHSSHQRNTAFEGIQLLHHHHHHHQSPDSSLWSDVDVPGEHYEAAEPNWSTSWMSKPDSYSSTALVMRPNNKSITEISDYEDTESFEERAIRMVVENIAMYHQIGDGVDPFVVLPQFQSPELDSLYLTRRCKSQHIPTQTACNRDYPNEMSCC